MMANFLASLSHDQIPARRLAAISLALLLGLGLFLATWWSGWQNLNDQARDWQWQILRAFDTPAPIAEPVIVGIDEAFLDSIDEPLVLTHHHLAEFLLLMQNAGAKAVALDLSLPEKRYDQIKSTSAGELDYHQSLMRGLLQVQTAGLPVVVAKVWDMQKREFRMPHLDYQALLNLQEKNWQALASAELCRDQDQRVRRFPGKACQPDSQALGLASEVLAASGQRQDWQGLINYRLGAPFHYIPLQQLQSLQKSGQTSQLRAMFANRVVVLGVILEATDLLDVPVPLAAWLQDDTRVPGVLVHAQLLRSMMNQALVQPVASGWYGLTIAIFCLVLVGPGRLSLVSRAAILMVLLLFCTLVSTLLLYHQLDWPIAQVLLAGMILLLTQSAYQALISNIDKRRLSKAFSGRVSPAVLDAIVKGNLGQIQQSQRRHLCVLFSDIRGFTSRCEGSEPEAIVSLLNRYFSKMTALVHQHGGTIDKFIGDGLMAFFGAPNRLEQPEMAALKTALAMRQVVQQLNQELQQEGLQTIAIGIGLHCGEAVVGQLGSAQRHEYTAIGDTVNTCARIEGLCKNLHQDLLCSEVLVENLPADYAVTLGHQFTSLGSQELKGRAAITLYAAVPYDSSRP